MIQYFTSSLGVNFIPRYFLVLLVSSFFVGCGSSDKPKSGQEVEKIDYSPTAFLVETEVNPPVSRVNEMVQFQFDLAKGKAPYEIEVDFDDDLGKTKLVASKDGFVNATRKYPSEGNKEISFTVKDAAGKITTSTRSIMINNALEPTKWNLSLKSIINNYVKNSIGFVAKSISDKQTDMAMYQLDKKFTPENDRTYTSTFSLPVPQDTILFNKKMRINFVVEPTSSSSSEFSFGFKTGNSIQLTANILSGSNTLTGSVVKENLLDGKSTIAQFTAAFNDEKEKAFAMELTYNRLLSIYRLPTNKPPVLLHKYDFGSDIQNQDLTELMVTLEENGKIKTTTLEYDVNNDGKYSADELLFLNTSDKLVDWNDISWVIPTKVADNSLEVYKQGASVLILNDYGIGSSCNIGPVKTTCEYVNVELNVAKIDHSVDAKNTFKSGAFMRFSSEKSDFIAPKGSTGSGSIYLRLGIDKSGSLISLAGDKSVTRFKQVGKSIRSNFYGIKQDKPEVFVGYDFHLVEKDYSGKPIADLLRSLSVNQRYRFGEFNEPAKIAFDTSLNWFNGLTDKIMPAGSKAYAIKYNSVAEEAFIIDYYVANTNRTGIETDISAMQSGFRGLSSNKKGGEVGFLNGFKFRLDHKAKTIEWTRSNDTSPEASDIQSSQYTVVQRGDVTIYKASLDFLKNRELFFTQINDENGESAVYFGIVYPSRARPRNGATFDLLNKIAFDAVTDALKNADGEHQLPAKMTIRPE